MTPPFGVAGLGSSAAWLVPPEVTLYNICSLVHNRTQPRRAAMQYFQVTLHTTALLPRQTQRMALLRCLRESSRAGLRPMIQQIPLDIGHPLRLTSPHTHSVTPPRVIGLMAACPGHLRLTAMQLNPRTNKVSLPAAASPGHLRLNPARAPTLFGVGDFRFSPLCSTGSAVPGTALLRISSIASAGISACPSVTPSRGVGG